MSVYKPKTARTWWYDFQFKGHRFVRDTGKSSAAAARKVEENAKRDAPAELARLKAAEAAAAEAAKNLNFNDAAGKWALEVGIHAKGGNTRFSLAWLLKHVGADTKIADINDAFVARLVAIRRSETIVQTGDPKKRKAKPRRVSNGTVNRTCTEPLRQILTRARDVWGQTVQKIDWGQHMLREPQEIVRELRDDQEDMAFDQAREDYLALWRFSIATGLRDTECLWPTLTWECFDWGNRVIKVTGKGGTVDLIPITAEIREIVWPLQGRHAEAVFCYRAVNTTTVHTKNGPRKLKEGEWSPITQDGRKSWWRRFRARMGGLNGFRWHDNRHTAGTRTLRETGNLKLTQQLLRHRDIATTGKYAHVLLEDLRAGMEATSAARAARKSQIKSQMPDADDGNNEGSQGAAGV